MPTKSIIFISAVFFIAMFCSANAAFAEYAVNKGCPVDSWVFSPAKNSASDREVNYELTFDYLDRIENERSTIARIYIKAFDLKTKSLQSTLSLEFRCDTADIEGCDAFYKDRHLHLLMLNRSMSAVWGIGKEFPSYLVFQSISDRIFEKTQPPLSREDARLWENFSDDKFPASAEHLTFWVFKECRAAK